MSDLGDGSGPIRRSPRIGEGGAPVSGALAIVLAVVAVVAGFLILRSISDGGDQELGVGTEEGGGDVDGGDTGDDTGNGDATGSTTATTAASTTTTEPFVTQGATVIVANANGQGGSAAAMTRALEAGPGFVMADPVNAAASVGDLAESVVYFDASNASAEAVANSVARALGGVGSVTALPTDVALTADGSLGDAHVLLMLGEDKANKTLEELNPATATGGATVITNPPVAADTTTTTTG